MTCAEFTVTVVAVNVTDMTRGERAAVVAHALRCTGCRAWVTNGAREPTADRKRQLQEMVDRDVTDPEFRDVVGGHELGGEG